jgi:UDP-glucose 4-epimerase
MKIAVTGASGFIGGNLCFYLEKNGHTVYPICNTTNLVSDHFRKTCYFSGVFGAREKVFSEVDGIMHMAANNDTLSDQSYEMIKANLIESKKLLKISKKYNHKFFIYASSTAVYGQTDSILTENIKTNPVNVYAKSKLKFDEYMIKTNPNIKWCGLRFCNVYGPYEQEKGRRSSYLGQIIKSMMDSKKVVGEVINIGPDEEFISINKLAEICSNVSGSNLKPEYYPDRPLEVKLAICSSDKARKLLNYKTTTNTYDAIKKTYEYIKSKGPKKFDYNISIEINNDLTPETWKKKIF